MPRSRLPVADRARSPKERDKYSTPADGLIVRDARRQRPGHRAGAPRARLATRADQHAALAADRLTCSRIVISTSSRLHISNSAVFFVPRRVSAPRFTAFLVCARPARGGRSAERRTFIPVARARRDYRVSETRAVPSDRDRRCRRSTVAISAEGPRGHDPTVPPYHCRASRGPAARPGPFRSRSFPDRGCTAVSGHHTRSASKNVSGDAPQ